MRTLQIFMGWDSREVKAFDVACASIRSRASAQVAITPLKLHLLEEGGLIWRRTENMVPGSLWDVISSAPMSTEFALSRFLVPLIKHDGWALFCDCDVIALADVAELFELADDQFAVMCVKHGRLPNQGTKMDGQAQTDYSRKNWSSVVLWNCDHPAHQRIDLRMVNTWPGDLLHRFAWLRDKEIGSLPAEWNWLVGIQPKPDRVKFAHFTSGGPWINNWKRTKHDQIWLNEQARMLEKAA